MGNVEMRPIRNTLKGLTINPPNYSTGTGTTDSRLVKMDRIVKHQLKVQEARERLISRFGFDGREGEIFFEHKGFKKYTLILHEDDLSAIKILIDELEPEGAQK